MRAGTPASRAELWRHGGKILADRPVPPAQHTSLVFQSPARIGVALRIPAELTPDLIGGSGTAIGWQQPEHRRLVVARDAARPVPCRQFTPRRSGSRPLRSSTDDVRAFVIQRGHGRGQSDYRRMLAGTADVVKARQQIGLLGLGPRNDCARAARGTRPVAQ